MGAVADTYRSQLAPSARVWAAIHLLEQSVPRTICWLFDVTQRLHAKRFQPALPNVAKHDSGICSHALLRSGHVALPVVGLSAGAAESARGRVVQRADGG